MLCVKRRTIGDVIREEGLFDYWILWASRVSILYLVLGRWELSIV